MNLILDSIIVDRQELETMLVVLKERQAQNIEKLQQSIESILDRLDRKAALQQVTVNVKQPREQRE